MTQTTPDPTTNDERVLVRSTATGFEQGIAAMAGLFTAGPVGALAAWGAIRGLQGKWAPWFILGIPASISINVVQLLALAAINSTWYEPEVDTKRYEASHIQEQQEQVTNI